MQLFKSLFCWRGFDNRIRFALIHGCSYLCFIFFSITFSPIVSTIFFFILAAMHLCSTQRRIQDAKLEKHWLITLNSTYLIAAITVLLIDSYLIYLLLLIPMAISLFLLTYPEKPTKHYILGYNGPTDLSEHLHKYQHGSDKINRIEPTFAGQHTSVHETIFEDNYTETPPSVNHSIPTDEKTGLDVGVMIRSTLHNNVKLVVILIGLIFIAIVAVIISNTGDNEGANQPLAVEQISEVIRSYPVTLPDNFTVMLSEHKGIIINWQAEQSTESKYWTLETAQGDRSCVDLSFNNGDKVRTLSVLVEQGNEYFAQFSPLDTQQIIKNIAFRGSFSLCGYTFSLKGSQAALGKNKVYADLIEY